MIVPEANDLQDFEYVNPTKLIFGRGVVRRVGQETAKHGGRVLLVSGRGSAKATGLYDMVVRSLREHHGTVFELSGVQPNPRLTTCLEGVRLCKSEQIDVVLGLGGGSVLDSAKAISAGACYAGKLWDFFEKKAVIENALPVVTVVTVAATGSEYNQITVIKNEERHAKVGLWNKNLFPRVSLVDPELTYTVGLQYTTYGAVDIISHVLERYVSCQTAALVQLRFKEALMRSVMEALEKVRIDLRDYEARSTLLWAGSLACSSIFDSGLGSSDIPAHIIDTEIGSFSDHSHGAGLAVILPAVMQFYVAQFPATLARFAVRVMGLPPQKYDSDIDLALAGIDAFRRWLQKNNCPVTLKDLGIGPERFTEIAEAVDRNEEGPDHEQTLAILEICRG
jgi:alcohol dehydrogenase YqhD (iron-dependent ADH family)